MPKTKASLNLYDTIIPGSATDSEAVEIEIIAIAGYGTPSVSTWSLESELAHQMKDLEGIGKIIILTFDFDATVVGKFSWQMILDRGSELLSLLLEYRQQQDKISTRPIIFLCHSLGGIILKQALYLGSRQLQGFGFVIDKIIGIVFLGTPHGATLSDQETCNRCTLIMKTFSKSYHNQKAKVVLDPDEVFKICNVAVQFERISIDFPILSVYEGQETKIGREKVFMIRTGKLVDKDLAQTYAMSEELMEAPLGHADLCKFRFVNTSRYPVMPFIRDILKSLKSKDRSGSRTLSTDSQGPQLERLSTASSNSSYQAQSRAIKSSPEGTERDFRSSFELLDLTPLSVPSSSRGRKARLPCFLVARHTRNSDFFGREGILEDIDKYLLPGPAASPDDLETKPRHYALCGMGGLGKTELAVEYVYSRRSKFGAVFWVESGSDSQLATDFNRISITLGLEDPSAAKDLLTSRNIVISWFTNSAAHTLPNADGGPVNTSWLLVFDNADKLDLLGPFWPKRGNGSILVTSRDPLAKSQNSFAAVGFDLEPLSPREGSQFIRIISNCEDDPDEQRASVELSTMLGGLPLAMVQMSGIIRRRGVSIEEFVETMQGDMQYQEVHDLNNPVQQARYGSTLATAWNFSDLNEETLNFLELLSLLNPDRIQEEIFIKECEASTDSKKALKIFREARTNLLSSSVIKRNIKFKELWIHRVIQHEVRVRMGPRKLFETFQRMVNALSHVWPFGGLEKRHETSRWAVCEALFPHLNNALMFYQQNKAAWADFAIDPKFVVLMNEAGAYRHERGFSYQGKPYLELAYLLYEKAGQSLMNDQSQQLISDTHFNLGCISNEINDGPSCLFHNSLLLRLREKITKASGKPDLRLGIACNQKGIADTMMGKYAAATELFRRSITVYQGLEGFTIDSLAFPRANLGFALWVQGQYGEAEEVLSIALTEREKEFGKMDSFSYKTGRILHGLGNVKAGKAMQARRAGDVETSVKEMAASLEFHKSALQQLESTLGPYHHRVADLCHKLAEHEIDSKDHELAQKHLDRALSIWGDQAWYKNQFCRSSFLKGTHLVSLGGESEAEGKQWIQRALTLRRQIVTDDEKTDDELEIADFDKLVVFWSR